MATNTEHSTSGIASVASPEATGIGQGQKAKGNETALTPLSPSSDNGDGAPLPPPIKPPPPQYLLDMLAAAKAERKAVRAERRAKRAEEERLAKKEAMKLKKKKAIQDAKLGLPPDLDDSNIWLFEQIDRIYDYWAKSKTRVQYNKYLTKYKHNRYLANRRITRTRYLIKKFYRRYIGVSPAVRQRRQLNKDFKYVPKTNLAASYNMNLDQLMYCNIFDKERSRFQTIRDREALIKMLKMPCVQGVASEVAFLLKADTDYVVDFVFRNHAFQETKTYSFRVTKRTLLPALQDSAFDFRLFYHRCRIPVPPRKHAPLHHQLFDKLFKPRSDVGDDLDREVGQNGDKEKGSLSNLENGDDANLTEEEKLVRRESRRMSTNNGGEGDQTEERAAREEDGSKTGENEEEEDEEDEDSVGSSRSARSKDVSIDSGRGEDNEKGEEKDGKEVEGEGGGDDDSGSKDIDQNESQNNNEKDGYSEMPAHLRTMKKKKKKTGEDDDESDDDSVMSDSSEQEALKVAQLLAKSAVSDYYAIIRTWFLEGEEEKKEKPLPLWKQAFTYLYRVVTRANAKVLPEEDDEIENDDAGEKDTENKSKTDRDTSAVMRTQEVDDDDEEENDEEEREKKERRRLQKEKLEKVFIKIKKTVLCRNEFKEGLRLHEKQVKEYREQERKRKDEENCLWFEDPSHTLFERNEMRINGPNRHLSDLSDATVIRPVMKPFPTTIDNATSCESYFYDEEAANLDSLD